MEQQPINFSAKFNLFSELWSPKIIAQMNEYHFKIAKIQGEFVWHSHPDTDETFIVIRGKMQILLREKAINLGEGEMFVVPKGVEHKPYADEECHILMIELAGTINTGDVVGSRTIVENVWI